MRVALHSPDRLAPTGQPCRLARRHIHKTRDGDLPITRDSMFGSVISRFG